MVTTMPVVRLTGSYGEMGLAYGKQLARDVDRNLQDYLRRFREVAGLRDGEVRSWGERYRRIAQEYDPSIRTMLDALAEGSGQPPALIFALNARTEILYGSAARDAPQADDGCTSLAVLPSHTEDGHVLLGQNWDWHPEQRDVTFLLETRDEEGFSVLTLAEAGMLAKSGFNSAGIGVCANLLVSSADRGGDGVPYHFLLRGVLQSHTMADALRATTAHPRISSGNLLLADAGGEAIDLEVCPGDFGYLLPEDGLLAHSNHFQTSVPVKDLRKGVSALTLLRPQRARHLLQEKLDRRAVAISDLQRVFRDHYSFPNGICRHVDERDGELDRVCSVYSLVFDLTDRRLLIAPHPICEHEYEELALGDLEVAGLSAVRAG
ncbi:MAG: C45 family autoproteolytic acyltransferase/hydrolase [Candidatus Dormibacteraceae bacterium]